MLGNTGTATSKQGAGAHKQKRKRLSGIIKNAIKKDALTLKDLTSMAI